MNPHEAFLAEVSGNIAALAGNRPLQQQSLDWLRDTLPFRYSYNFSWLGRPIIQYPTDLVALQELLWRVQPDLVIETGIAHGGSLVMSASFLALLDYADAVRTGTTLDPARSHRRVLGIDIDIRAHNRAALDAHPMRQLIDLVEGSSIAHEVLAKARAMAADRRRVLVLLDSNHTHEHVLAELRAYGPMVTAGSYCVVLDTIIERLSADAFPDRPWGPGNSPMTAVDAYLTELRDSPVVAQDGQPLRFEIDEQIDAKLLVSTAPRGYLKRLPCSCA